MTSGEEGAGRASGGLWDSLAQGVQAAPAPAADLWATLSDRLDFSRSKPRQAAGVEVAAQQSAKTGEHYVLRNPLANTYLRVDAQDYFLWQHLDGEHSVRDLAVAYFAQYRAFPFDRLVHLIAQLKAKGMLEQKAVRAFDGVGDRLAAGTLAYRLQRFAETSTQKQLSVRNVDALFTRLYARLRLLFTAPALAVGGLLAIAGLLAFVRLLAAGTYPLVSTAGSYGLGLLVLLVANYAMVFCHECGHALACKHFGRSVLKGGVLFYYGSPAFFVDTTDIWMAPKAARVAVSCAGPAADLAVSGLVCCLLVLFPHLALGPVLFQLAAVGYLSVLTNLAPVMELDGYFILMDWLEIPLLRRKSLAFVRHGLLPKLRRRTAFGREERLFATYGLLTAAYTVLSVALAAYVWQSQVRGLVTAVLGGRDVLTAVVAGGLIVVAGLPLLLGLAIRGILLAGRGATWLRMAAKH